LAILGALLIMQVLSWIIMLAIAVGCSYWANLKGYSRWIWFFASSWIALIVIACMPKIDDLEESKKEKQRSIGNTIGIVMLVASFTWGFAQGFLIK
jgi:hypothetical protein